jgi:hypothetical protein
VGSLETLAESILVLGGKRNKTQAQTFSRNEFSEDLGKTGKLGLGFFQLC